ncbi:recombinase family protein [Mesorhizobium huakuii]|uniref:Recombinase family protein n=1 Tax=Mesorhizobium huakuii TaxID=28104 RepID=A0ABZ0VP06_9HYPH|nr:recombinase family protein [Mesorhizobium huakuii]WQB99202.1 recombinase family protein [Mesorhizobium huakuii]
MTAAGAEEVFGEKRSGLDETRPELEKALELAHEGDVFVVTKVDRLARSAARLHQIVKDARQEGCGFQGAG